MGAPPNGPNGPQKGGPPPWISPQIQQEIAPRDGDIWISVPAKSGTNWMMNIVYQLLTGGDDGFDSIYSVVPWPEFVEPGACSINCDICRPLTGSPWTSLSVTLAPTLAELSSRTGAAAMTATVSVTPAGLNSKSNASSWPTVTGICVYSTDAKPSLATEIV